QELNLLNDDFGIDVGKVRAINDLVGAGLFDASANFGGDSIARRFYEYVLGKPGDGEGIADVLVTHVLQRDLHTREGLGQRQEQQWLASRVIARVEGDR